MHIPISGYATIQHYSSRVGKQAQIGMYSTIRLARVSPWHNSAKERAPNCKFNVSSSLVKVVFYSILPKDIPTCSKVARKIQLTESFGNAMEAQMLDGEGFHYHNHLQAHYRYEIHKYHINAKLFDLKIIGLIALHCIISVRYRCFP